MGLRQPQPAFHIARVRLQPGGQPLDHGHDHGSPLLLAQRSSGLHVRRAGAGGWRRFGQQVGDIPAQALSSRRDLLAEQRQPRGIGRRVRHQG